MRVKNKSESKYWPKRLYKTVKIQLKVYMWPNGSSKQYINNVYVDSIQKA